MNAEHVLHVSTEKTSGPDSTAAQNVSQPMFSYIYREKYCTLSTTLKKYLLVPFQIQILH